MVVSSITEFTVDKLKLASTYLKESFYMESENMLKLASKFFLNRISIANYFIQSAIVHHAKMQPDG